MTRRQNRRSAAERLWSRVAKGGPDECWPWLGWCDKRGGHGQIAGDDGRLMGTHRVAYESAKGPIPAGLHVRHTCDNPPCCNPAHLLVGTHADNMRDAIERDRMAREFRMPHTRISDAEVRAIRKAYQQGPDSFDSVRLAERFGVNPSYIRQLARGYHRASA